MPKELSIVRYVPGLYPALMLPTPPPFSPHSYENNNVTSIITRSTCENKAVTDSKNSHNAEKPLETREKQAAQAAERTHLGARPAIQPALTASTESCSNGCLIEG